MIILLISSIWGGYSKKCLDILVLKKTACIFHLCPGTPWNCLKWNKESRAVGKMCMGDSQGWFHLLHFSICFLINMPINWKALGTDTLISIWELCFQSPSILSHGISFLNFGVSIWNTRSYNTNVKSNCFSIRE